MNLMHSSAAFQQCLAFIDCQLRPSSHPPVHHSEEPRWRAVTISRQSGTDGHVFAETLAGCLQAHGKSRDAPWLVFDRNLVTKVLEDHQLPERLAKFMPEDRVSEIEDGLEELFGVHPPVESLVRKTAETILQLAGLGNVILVGRGAAVITARMDHVFHVRLIGSLAKRVERIQDRQGIGNKAALKFVRDEDRGRRAYLKKYYHADIDDPLLYHVTINTDLFDSEQAAGMIGNVVLSGALSHTAKQFLEETSK